MRRVGDSATPEQPEEIQREIEGLRTEIEDAGNQLVDELEAFLGRLDGSSDPSDRTAAQAVLQRLKGFSLQASEGLTGSTATTSPVPAPSDPPASANSSNSSFMTKVVAFMKTIPENARQNGGSSKRSNSEPKP